jgi:hypothetical protein
MDKYNNCSRNIGRDDEDHYGDRLTRQSIENDGGLSHCEGDGDGDGDGNRDNENSVGMDPNGARAQETEEDKEESMKHVDGKFFETNDDESTSSWVSRQASNFDDLNDEKSNCMNIIQVPCQAKDVGSFFAALCAIGTHVEIGTKVRLMFWELSLLGDLIMSCRS